VLGFRKLVVGVFLGWVCSIAAYSGFMGPECVGETIELPCEALNWNIAGDALYLQSPHWPKNFGQYQNQNTVWSYGFQLVASLQYLKGNEFNIEWYHYRHQSSQNLVSSLSFNQVVSHAAGPTTPIAYDELWVNQENLTFKPQWDQVNIEFAKLIGLGNSDETRLYAGFNYSRVAYSGSSFFDGQTLQSDILNTYQNLEIRNASFSGFGLRTGIDLAHFWLSGLKIYSKAAVSILAGTSQSSIQWSEQVNGISYDGIDASHRYRIVPEFDGQIGLGYRYSMTQGDMNLHVAWLWVNYLSAWDTAQNHVGLQGLDFGLRWTGDFI